MSTKILVVDKEPDLQMLIEQKFRKKILTKELVFVFANDAETALESLLKDDNIEILITEVKLPKMDGLQLLQQLKGLPRILKSVIVSPYGDLDSIRTAMNFGAYDFVTRPINLNDLETTITKTIDNLQSSKETKINESRLMDIDKEIDVAKNIQGSIIPHNFKPYKDNNSFEILGTMLPARKIGGDFFDFFPLPHKKLGFSIADVSGKGIPAALFMTMSRGLLRALGQKTTSPLECLIQLNELLTLENDSAMFVTCFYGILEIETGLITYANAGHNPPLVIRESGEIEEIGRSQGIALGVTVDILAYEEHTLKLNKNDTFLLYTDGVTEAMNPKRELFGEKRLHESVEKYYKKPLSELIQSLVQDVEAYSIGSEQTDDITLLAVRMVV